LKKPISDIRMKNIRTVDLNLLVVFDALFDERSVTRAADRLAVTQPTVSGLLKRLRQTFTDQLFLRTSHGILPTPRAEALAGPVKDLLANAQSLVTPEAFDPATAETTIMICGSDYMQHAVISPLIEAIRKVAPKIKVLVAPRPAANTLADLFTRGEMDLCISAREVVDPDLISRLLYRDRYICVARKKHPLKARRISVKQLCAFDHLLVDPTGESFSGAVDTSLSKLDSRRRVAMAVPTFHLLFDILGSDDFIAFVPERLLRKRRSDLRVFETNLALPAIEVLATWHPRLNGDAQHKWLRELLVKVAKAQ
jgi:DNA-binding transcriptional LysR family regulator